MQETIFPYLDSENTGIWIDKRGPNVFFVIKTNQIIIKSILNNATVKLTVLLYGNKNTMKLMATIYDNAERPFVITYTPRSNVEVSGLYAFITGEFDDIKLMLFDEFSMNTSIIDINSNTIYQQLMEIDQDMIRYSLVSNTDEAISVMNNEVELNEYYDFLITQKQAKTFLSCCIEPDGERVSYNPSDAGNGREGYTQEDLIHHALKTFFSNESVFHSPTIIEGIKKREFVDVLVMDEEHLLVVQSKALCLIESGLKSYKRLCSDYYRGCNKGINQVRGVIPLLKSELKLNDSEVTIPVCENKNIYHMVIVSELLLSEEHAKDVFDRINKLHTNDGAKIIIMSFEGLINFIKICVGNRVKFWKYLELRFNASISNNTIMIKDIDSSLNEKLKFKL